jgi:hypothetical protein
MLSVLKNIQVTIGLLMDPSSFHIEEPLTLEQLGERGIQSMKSRRVLANEILEVMK